MDSLTVQCEGGIEEMWQVLRSEPQMEFDEELQDVLSEDNVWARARVHLKRKLGVLMEVLRARSGFDESNDDREEEKGEDNHH